MVGILLYVTENEVDAGTAITLVISLVDFVLCSLEIIWACNRCCKQRKKSTQETDKESATNTAPPTMTMNNK